MSHIFPIPRHKSDIAACTAMAGEMLGLQLIYMDGGSGADQSINTEMIAEVRKAVITPYTPYYRCWNTGCKCCSRNC